MLIIAISYYDNYIDRVEKIINESPNNVSYLYIEDYLNGLCNDKINNEDVIYILNNSENNFEFIKQIKKTGCKILNLDFYAQKYNKIEIQRKLHSNKINIPRIINYSEIMKQDFPIFCKSYQHADMVMKIYNKSTLENLIKNFNKDMFYFEESLDKGNYKEYKVYFVKDQIYLDDDIIFNGDDNILNICRQIGQVLKLDIHTSDIIKCEDKYYVIDVNPSAGLYKSSKSRQALIKEF